MTVSTTNIRRSTTGDGTKTDFSFDFYLADKSHMQVWIDGVQQFSGWSVSTTVPRTGGMITFAAAPAQGASILIVRQVPLTQSVDLPVVGQIPSESLEGMADTATMQIQQIADQIERIPALPVTSDIGSLVFPLPGEGELIRWNASGTALETVDPDDVLIGGTLPAPENGKLLIWNGSDLANVDPANVTQWQLPPGTGDVVGPASATNHSIAFFNGTTGKLLKSTLGLGTSGQKLVSAGAGAMPQWQSDAGSISPADLGKLKNQTIVTYSNLAVKLSNEFLVQGGLSIYQARGADNGYVPIGQVVFSPINPPPANATIVDWAYNQSHLYVVMSNGWAYSAGQNAAGQLGHGDTTARYVLTRVEYFVTNNHDITKVFCTAGSPSPTVDSVFWVTSANKIYAAGLNGNGQLGIGSTTNASTPTLSYNASGNTIVDLQTVFSVAGWSALILSDGSLRVVGNNANGQIGNGNTTQQTSWVLNGGISNAIAMRCFQGSSAGVRGGANIAVVTSASSGSLYVWGANNFYQGADGGTSNKTAPSSALLTAVNSNYFGFIGADTYIGVYCLLDNGDLHTWGYNGNNSLFANNTTTKQTPSKSCNQNIVGVWGVLNANGAGPGMIYALDTSNVMRFTGSAAMLPYCAFAAALCPDYASGTRGVYRCALPTEISQGDDDIASLLIQAKAGNSSHSIVMITSGGSLYGGGYASDNMLTNWQSQVSQPSRIFNHRLNRYLWGV